MPKILIFAAILLASSVNAVELTPLDLRPSPAAEWEAQAADVKAVLDSAARQLWKHFPGRTLPPILVAPKGGPITLFQRGPNGELQVKLSTGKTLWSQYAFQFGHEFCHILCGFQKRDNPNHWFEESLCEVASLFVLRRMAEEWAASPPYPNWKGYAVSLKQYADTRIAEAPLPKGMPLANWYRENEAALRANSTDRPKNCVVAGELLALFEAEPEMWRAVETLNAAPATKLTTFRQFMEGWHRESDEKYRPFIRKIATKFEAELK